MRHAAAVLAATFLATLAAFGASIGYPERADAASTVKSCTGGEVRLSAAEKQMLELHNWDRASRELPPLCVHPKLQKAASAHSREMIRRELFTHGNVSRRLGEFGYRWSDYAENIRRDDGRPSPESAFEGWMLSSLHESNIRGRRFDEVGVGAATGNFGGAKTTLWTVDFGTRH
jgi:uncharacterized protein YkwD